MGKNPGTNSQINYKWNVPYGHPVLPHQKLRWNNLLRCKKNEFGLQGLQHETAHNWLFKWWKRGDISCLSRCWEKGTRTLRQKVTIHRVNTMLATFKNARCPGQNYLLTTGTDDSTLWLSPECQRVNGSQYRWFASGYNLEIRHFKKWLAWCLPGG